MGEPAEGRWYRETSEAGPGGMAPGQEEGARWAAPVCRITAGLAHFRLADASGEAPPWAAAGSWVGRAIRGR